MAKTTHSKSRLPFNPGAEAQPPGPRRSQMSDSLAKTRRIIRFAAWLSLLATIALTVMLPKPAAAEALGFKILNESGRAPQSVALDATQSHPKGRRFVKWSAARTETRIVNAL
jgi:hypothetical protein